MRLITNCVETFHMSIQEVLDTSFVIIIRMIEEHNEDLKEKDKNSGTGKPEPNKGFESVAGIPGCDIG